MPKTCFVIGPIGDREDEIRVHADKVLKYIIQPCTILTTLDYEAPLRADKFSDPGRITPQIVEKLRTADLIIADLTFSNPNVYYELSLRHALGKPVIHICHDGTRLSFDIVDNRTIFFTFDIARVEAAREELERQITRTHEPDYKVRNPIVDTIGLIQLEQSAQPVEQHLARLGRDVEQMNLQIQTIQTMLAQGSAVTPYGAGAGTFGLGSTWDASTRATMVSAEQRRRRSQLGGVLYGATGLPWSEETLDAPPPKEREEGG